MNGTPRDSARRAADRPSAAQRIRVGGMVTPLKLLRQTRPVYPPDLQQLGVEGTVIMRAIISKDGAVLQPAGHQQRRPAARQGCPRRRRRNGNTSRPC